MVATPSFMRLTTIRVITLGFLFSLGHWPSSCEIRGGTYHADPTVANIAAKLAQHFRNIDSLYVRYRVRAEPLVETDVLKKQLNMRYLVHNDHEFAFKGTKRYYRLVEPEVVQGLPDEDGPTPQLRTTGGTEVAFDGNVMRRLTPVENIVDILGPDNVENDSAWFNQDYLFRIGMPLPDPLDLTNDRKESRLAEMLVKKPYEIVAESEVVGDVQCIVIEYPSHDKIWVDRKIEYGIRMREISDPETGILVSRVSNTDFEQVADGIWLPRTSVRELCGPASSPEPYRGSPLVRYTLTVTQIRINDVPDSRFTFSISAGTTIFDGTVLPVKDGKNQYVSYVMPAKERDVGRAIDRALKEMKKTRKDTVMWPTVLGVNLAIALIVVAILIYRRYRFVA